MMAESLVELVVRVAAEYQAAKSRGGEKSEKSEKSPPGAILSSHISLISQSEKPRRSGGGLLDAADLRDRYEERAAIRQHDGGESAAAEAEAMAWHEVAAIWHRQQGKRVPSHVCAGCGQPLDGANVLLLPYGERAHADAGDYCVHLYGNRWKRLAAIVLAAIGIPTPPEIEMMLT